MKFLQELLSDEQAFQLITDIKASLNIRKAGVCEAEQATAQDAKTPLLVIFTKIMMTKTGFVIEKSLKECGREIKDLKEEEEYIERHRRAINAKISEN